MKIANLMAAGVMDGERFINKATRLLDIGMWPFNDLSGTVAVDRRRRNNATYSGVTLNQTGIGDGRKSVSLDGSSSKVYVSGTGLTNLSALLNGSEFSFHGYFKPDSSVWTDSYRRYLVVLQIDSNNFFSVYEDTVNGNFCCRYKAGGTDKIITTRNISGHSGWTQILVSVSKTDDTMNLYINRNLAAYGTGLGTWSGGTLTQCYFGFGSATPANVLTGNMAYYGLANGKKDQVFANSLWVNQPEKPVVFFGDSITAGQQASVESKRFANLIATSVPYTWIVNAGIGSTMLQNTGGTSNNGRDTFSSRVNYYNPAKVFILYGVNDIRYRATYGCTAEIFQTQLGETISGIINSGVSPSNIVLGNIPYFTSGNDETMHLAMNSACQTVATETGVKFANIYDAMVSGGGDTLLNADLIHPNDAGHQVIATTFESAI